MNKFCINNFDICTQVFVFIERHSIGRSAIMQKMKNIIIRCDNIILLQFIMPTNNGGKLFLKVRT